MNSTKLKYAKARLESILQTKILALRKKYIKPGQALTVQKKVDLIRKGAVKIKKKIEYPRYGEPDLSEIFDFSDYEWEIDYQREKTEKRVEKLKKKFRVCMDEIMLGDEAKALELIRRFKHEN